MYQAPSFLVYINLWYNYCILYFIIISALNIINKGGCVLDKTFLWFKNDLDIVSIELILHGVDNIVDIFRIKILILKVNRIKVCVVNSHVVDSLYQVTGTFVELGMMYLFVELVS